MRDRLGGWPIYADLKLTPRCSGKCLICNYWSREHAGELETYQWKKIIFRLKQAGVFQVCFTGGDILLRGDLWELIDYARSLGLVCDCSINGLLVDEIVAGKFAGASVSCVYISHDGPGEREDRIRGIDKAGWKALRALELLRAKQNENLNLALSMTIMKDTLGSIKPVTSVAIENRVPIIFNLIHFTHHFTDTPEANRQYRLNGEDFLRLLETVHWLKDQRARHPGLLPHLTHLEWIGKYFSDYRQLQTPCFKPMLKVCIDHMGNASPCCSQNPVGNLLRQDLPEILRSRAYWRVVRSGLDKQCPGCSCHYPLSLGFNVFSLCGELGLRTGLLHFSPWQKGARGRSCR